ncbi:MAG: OmpA family protein, partial [Bacteroidota bacterium]|nr:OmpA family protein [Bacteroidota bacterium]
TAFAQGDLIENGSFEELKGKLKKPGSFEMVMGWTSPTLAKADLFSAQVEEGFVSALKNPYGTQQAKSGEHYAGIRVYSANDREPRSYLQTTLKEPLMAGKKYCVKYHLSFADLSRFATTEVRAYLSTGSVEKDDMAILGNEAQIPDTGNAMISEMNEWKVVCGIYEASGGEQNLIIGNFIGTKETKVGKIKKPKGEVRPQVQHGYYFIDDISVLPVTVSAECQCGASKASAASTGFIFGRSAIEGNDLSPAQKIDSQVFYFQRTQRSIHSSMKPFINELAELMKADSAVHIKLTGHVDELEKEQYKDREDQDQLGRERAEAVKAALVALGVEADRITAEGRSDEELKDAGGSEIGMSKNRRVEVDLVE